MTSHELAKKLLNGPDLPVHHAYPAGDHWRTTLAPTVDKVEDAKVGHSPYHGSDFLIGEDEDGDTDNERRVIVLS